MIFDKRDHGLASPDLRKSGGDGGAEIGTARKSGLNAFIADCRAIDQFRVA